MRVQEIFVGDELTELEFTIVQTVNKVTTPIDLTGATLELKIRRPDGSLVHKTAGETLVDAVNGVVHWLTAATDINTAGTYLMQPYIELAGGWKGHAEPVGFTASDPV